MFYLTAFLVGFLGSFHCAGMCGPIAMALPRNASSNGGMVTGRLLYNIGRIATYVLLGLVAGLIGHTLVLAGFQKTLSVASGILILLIASGSLFYQRIRMINVWIAKYTSAIKKIFRKIFGQKSKFTLFLVGLVNGLLPCGFVYIAVTAAAASGSVTGSAGYMALFGLGTLPMMLFISLAGNFFGMRFNRLSHKATPYMALLVAVLLIARGILMTGPSCCHH